ncbi:hypothetical protein [Nitrospira sp. Nam80]
MTISVSIAAVAIHQGAQALRFTLREIKELLDLRVMSMVRCGNVQKMLG